METTGRFLRSIYLQTLSEVSFENLSERMEMNETIPTETLSLRERENWWVGEMSCTGSLVELCKGAKWLGF